MSSPDAERSILIEEIVDAGSYTYLFVKEGDDAYWMAVTKDDFEEGQTLYFTGSMEMKDFKSKELDRTFERILFVDQVYNKPGQSKVTKREVPAHGQDRMSTLLDSIKIAPAKGGLSIEELYKRADEFKNKEVIVKGQIVKINKDIMDRNWVHIMDGTKGDKSDLTFTTQSDFQIGDTVVVKGIVAVDKDFGGGYVYPLILEEADLLVE